MDVDLTEFPPLEEVNLTNCDREPIHIPGSIQPHGILLVLSDPELMIEQVSNNTHRIIGIAPQALLGQPLLMLLDEVQIAALQNCLQGNFEHINPLRVTVNVLNQIIPFDGIIHRSLQNEIILELEPFTEPPPNNFFDFYQMTKDTLTQIQQATNLSQLCAVMVKEVRRLTHFDRIMIYQFDADGAGNVIAEDKADELEPFLGLHYPDSDIPKQARRLYALNLLRLIPDIKYQPVAVLTSPLSAPPTPLDLSFSVLRSVSPMHIEYLSNMGVGASMSISLMKDQKLWGLIACHHYTPKFVPYRIRTACEFLGQVMSLELSSREANENLDYKVYLKSIQSRFIDAISQAEYLADGLVRDPDNLLALVGAAGAAIFIDDNLSTIGKTPAEPEIYALIEWLEDKFEQDLFISDALPHQYPAAATFKQVASGLLALSITKIRKNYLLWFRPEILQYVNWAGDPSKQQHIEPDGSITLSPRRSFDLWQETVQGKSLPWQSCEVEGALELRSAIVGIVLRKADEIATINLELERSNAELDAFTYIASHDLKEPLRGIHNYAAFLLKDYAETLDTEGVAKLETLVRLTKRMEDLINSLLRFSRLGRQELNRQPLDLNELMQNVSEVLHMSQRDTPIQIRIPRPLPIIHGDRVLIEEVFTNLISNGFKYNSQPAKWVEVGFIEPSQQTPQQLAQQTAQEAPQQISPSTTPLFYIRDNGIGIRQEHLDIIFRIFKRLHAPGKYGGGTGAGLTIVKKIIERHGGQIWVESTYGEGSTFYFSLPD